MKIINFPKKQQHTPEQALEELMNMVKSKGGAPSGKMILTCLVDTPEGPYNEYFCVGFTSAPEFIGLLEMTKLNCMGLIEE